MDRRTFIATGAWFSTGAFAPMWLAEVAGATENVGATDTRRALAVFDASLAEASAFTDHAARLRLPAFDIGEDIGALWHTTLAPRIARAPAVLVGVARAADFFVLTRLAQRPGGHIVPAAQTHRLSGTAAVSFVLPV
jgi:hypothetical protein